MTGLVLLLVALLAAVAVDGTALAQRVAQVGLRQSERGVCPANVPWGMRVRRGFAALGRRVVRRQDPGRTERAADPLGIRFTGAPVLLDERLVLSTMASGLTLPTTMAFLDDGTLLILEKNTGRLQHVSRSGTRPLLDLAVNNNLERGALGIARHPSFDRQPFVYLYWTWNGRGEGPRGLEGPDSNDPLEAPRRGNRLDRFRWTGTQLLFDRNVLLLPSVAAVVRRGHVGLHNGGVLAFDARGRLYVAVGDNHLRGRLQNIAAGLPPTDDNLAGVVLRLNDEGTAPTDNPFYAVGRSLGGNVGENLQRIFAYGIRNSFGMALDPLTGTLWMSENGNRGFDEINQVPPGFNSGWTQTMGPVRCYPDFRDIEERGGSQFRPQVELAPTGAEALRRLYDLPGGRFLDPLFSWRDAVAPTAVAFARLIGGGTDMFVGDYRGNLYRFTLSQDRERLVFADPRLLDGVANNYDVDRTAETETLLVGKNFGIVADLKVAPDGSLYLVSLTRGEILRIGPR